LRVLFKTQPDGDAGFLESFSRGDRSAEDCLGLRGNSIGRGKGRGLCRIDERIVGVVASMGA
jgi:hypothetical protein